MPRGFVGNAAARYLSGVSDAHESAVQSGNRIATSTTRAVNATNGISAFSAATSDTHMMRASNRTTMHMASVRTHADSQPPAFTLAPPRERRLPFSPEDAHTGSFSVGRRDSSNIVADYNQQISANRIISTADNKFCECLHNVTQEIETLFRSSFAMPAAAPRCLNISDSVKQSLGQSRTLTEDLLTESRRFTDRITDVGL